MSRDSPRTWLVIARWSCLRGGALRRHAPAQAHRCANLPALAARRAVGHGRAAARAVFDERARLRRGAAARNRAGRRAGGRCPAARRTRRSQRAQPRAGHAAAPRRGEEYEVACRGADPRGADVLARSKNGETALHLAALDADPALAELLLAAGADPRRAIRCESVLMWASISGHIVVAHGSCTPAPIRTCAKQGNACRCTRRHAGTSSGANPCRAPANQGEERPGRAP